MVIKWFSHHIILYCKYILRALLALGFGNHLSFCLAMRRRFPTQTFAGVAGATHLAGTKSGTMVVQMCVPMRRVMGWWQQWKEVGMVWEASESWEQGWGRCQEMASSQLAASTPQWGCGLSQMGQHKWFSKARSKMLYSSLHPWGVYGSPSPLEPVWGSTHAKSPKITSSCPRAALTFLLPCPTDVYCQKYLVMETLWWS